MKKRNLVAQKANLNKTKIFLKDRKIERTYDIFKKVLFKNFENRTFAVGVSGGPDSLALSFLAKIYSIKKYLKIKYLIVDHRLRKNSTAEAKNVQKKLTELRKYVEKNAEYVGDNFASEVRSIHYDKKNVRNIYGKTSLEENKELIEEGIEINSIPWVDKTDS